MSQLENLKKLICFYDKINEIKNNTKYNIILECNILLDTSLNSVKSVGGIGYKVLSIYEDKDNAPQFNGNIVNYYDQLEDYTDNNLRYSGLAQHDSFKNDILKDELPMIYSLTSLKLGEKFIVTDLVTFLEEGFKPYDSYFRNIALKDNLEHKLNKNNSLNSKNKKI